MMQQMAAYASSNITTELIQKYLDENKQLILAILDNQNLGKLNDCAMYQAKLQQNLMYLAAIADAQPQGAHNPPQAAAPVPPSIQPAQHYLQQQQQQQHQQQQHLFMSQRNSIPQYLQQSQQASQQSFYTQQAMMSGEGSGLHMLSSERGMGDNGPQLSAGFSDGGGGGGSTRDGNQSSLGLRGGGMHHGGGGGGGGGEASYLKGSDASSL
ncbi:unnamed protein product [Sphagnum jensenii]|uniref:SS18 N-terminal domain-containing protein n=1 Tax=Sphagnum jensenii TaxID=128206 RepID=A0ABP1ARU1_9BRYO